MIGRPGTSGEWVASLSLAVKLVDGFTAEGPIRGTEVRLESGEEEPVANRSGYVLFLDLPSGSVTLVVDGGDQYLDERRENVDVIDLSDPSTDIDPADHESLPVETIVLFPSPAYQLPSGTTLVRGVLRDVSEQLVSGAEVSIRDLDCSVGTDANGEFAVSLDVRADSVTVEPDGAVTVAESEPTIDVSHPTYGTLSERVNIEEGKVVSIYLTYP